VHVLLDDQKSINKPDIHEHPLLRYLLSMKDEVTQWAKRRLIEPATADEAFGDIYLRLYDYCTKYTYHNAKPAVMRAFISRSVSHYCIDQNRRAKRECQELDEAMPDITAQYPFEAISSGEIMFWDAIRELPKPYQQPVWLCCVERLPAKEGAEILGVTVTAFKSRLYRGRHVLRTKMKDAYPMLY
jgi:RNA polymerase sigma factor (sigma-70 family)